MWERLGGWGTGHGWETPQRKMIGTARWNSLSRTTLLLLLLLLLLQPLSRSALKHLFHLRPAAYGEMLISTTTSMGRTKILQFLPLRPPLGRTTKTCFCVGSDGHIRVECGSTHPSTRGYMILATTNPHSSPIQPNPHKSLQYLANHKVYIELNASFEYIL